MSRDHRKLAAFRHADQFALLIYEATRSFPREEVYGITSQLRRAASSAAANIVEGSARESEADYRHFLSIALGSLREAGYFVTLAQRLGYVDEKKAIELLNRYEESAMTLAGLIRSLKPDVR